MALLSLRDDQIDIWQTSVSLFEENHALDGLQLLLTKSDKAHIAQIRRSSEQKVKIVSRAFLRSVLTKYTGIAPTQLCFSHGLHGKPRLANIGVSLEFNLSHSDNILACAVSRSFPVGIDVERVRSKRNLKRLGESVLSRDEWNEFDNLTAQEQQDYFFDRWALKESFIKAIGQGLTAKLNKVSFGRQDAVSSFSVNGTCLVDTEGSFSSWLWPISSQYRLAVTIMDETQQQRAIKIRSFNWLPKHVPKQIAA